jgi:hypothetical protein
MLFKNTGKILLGLRAKVSVLRKATASPVRLVQRTPWEKRIVRVELMNVEKAVFVVGTDGFQGSEE